MSIQTSTRTAVTVYASCQGETITKVELIDIDGITVSIERIELDGLVELGGHLTEQGLTLTDDAASTFEDGLVLSVQALPLSEQEIVDLGYEADQFFAVDGIEVIRQGMQVVLHQTYDNSEGDFAATYSTIEEATASFEGDCEVARQQAAINAEFEAYRAEQLQD